jgi:hypothetical protein
MRTYPEPFESNLHLHTLFLYDPFSCFGSHVPGMILLRNLKGAKRLDREKDVSAHVLACTS